jgi:hypothetical protein
VWGVCGGLCEHGSPKDLLDRRTATKRGGGGEMRAKPQNKNGLVFRKQIGGSMVFDKKKMLREELLL